MRKLLLISTAIVLAACSNLTDTEKATNKAISSGTKSALALIKNFDKGLESYSEEDKKIISPYIISDKWIEQSNTLRQELETQEGLYKTGLKTASKSGKVADYLARENKEVTDLKKRVDFLVNTPDRIILLEKTLPAISKSVDGIIQISKARVSDATKKSKMAISKHTTRKDEIENRLGKLVSMRDSIESLNKALQAASEPKSIDLGVIDSSYVKIKKIDSVMKADTLTFINSLPELDKDYTLILNDMKTEYFVQLAVQSWNNYSDGRSSDVKTFAPVAISARDYEYLEANQNLDSIANYTGNSVGPLIDSGVWGRIYKGGATMLRRGDNRGSVWIEDVFPTYYHKYIEVKGSTKSVPKWEEVDEEDYARHLNDFGMAIESKPLGFFADESINEAIPPSMDKVGNKAYGEWKSDGNGNSFWHYYGQFAFFNSLMSGPVNRNDYNNYNSWSARRRGGQGSYGYYGANRTTPIYGSSGSHTIKQPSYKSSPFAKSGGVKAVPQSLKNKSASIRTRGPGSRGK